MKKYYAFADLEFEIDIPDPWMYRDDRNLASFRVCQAENPQVFRFEMVTMLTAPKGECLANTGGLRVYGDGSRYIGSVESAWENAYARVFREADFYRVQLRQSQFPSVVAVHTVLGILGAEHLIARSGGFILHSSYIERNGKAILFTAPSGTGKSTQAELWRVWRDAKILNGDRTAIRCDGRTVRAYGIPFAGSSQICENVTLPLDVIVYLKQAPQTTIRRLRGAEAFRRVWEGCSINNWDRTDVECISAAVSDVLMTVPVYELACTPDESAIIALEGVLPR